MAKLKGELQADNGDVLYPHTSSDVVFSKDGKSIEEQINVLNGRFRGNILSLEQVNSRELASGSYYIDGTVASNILGVQTIYACSVLVNKFDFSNQGYPTQYISSTKSGEIYVRQFDGDAQSFKLFRLATTTKTDISLLNGWVKTNPWFPSTIVRVGNLATINLRVSNGRTEQNTIISNIPSGFLPLQNTPIIFYNPATGETIGSGSVKEGKIEIYKLDTNADVFGTCTYVCG